MQEFVKGMLESLGLAKDSPNFLETPERVARSLKEMILNPEQIKLDIDGIFSKSFPTNYQGMILVSDIIAFSMCPHHMLPVEYNITIAYIPRATDAFMEGKVIGLSKIIRVAQLLAKQAILQEDYTQEIADTFKYYLQVKGVAVITKGLHNCIRCRGVKSQSPVMMSVLTGPFQEDSKTREEMFELIKLGRS